MLCNKYSLIHQGLIKVLVIQELNRIQTPWEQFLVESGFETQRIQKFVLVANTKSPKKTSSSKNKLKMAQAYVSSITKETRSSKGKLMLHEQYTSRQELVSTTKRQKSCECKRVYTRKRVVKITVKPISPSRENITSLVREMEESLDTIQNQKGNKRTQQKGKIKHLADYAIRLRTQSTNKFRMNAKALFDPSLKEGKPINIYYEAPEDTLVVTSKETQTIKTLKDMPMKKTTSVKRQKVDFVVEISKSYDKA
jgi:hypothetical protein